MSVFELSGVLLYKRYFRVRELKASSTWQFKTQALKYYSLYHPFVVNSTANAKILLTIWSFLIVG